MQTSTICLGILRSGPATGYVIKSVLEGPLNQIYNLSFGSIYPALSKLTKDKYVTVKQHAQDKKPDKKVYTITKKGISYFEETLLAYILQSLFRLLTLLFPFQNSAYRVFLKQFY